MELEMNEPKFFLHGYEWSKYLNYFQKGISFIYLQDVTDGKITENDEIELITEKARTLASQYFKTITDNKEEILDLTLVGMREYLNFYQVYPQEGEHDEFKGIFYTGMAISKILVKLGLLDLNKLHLKAVLLLMDHRLESPLNARRNALSERISSMINNNVLDDHLGKYGWYLIYKCLFNATEELKNKTDK